MRNFLGGAGLVGFAVPSRLNVSLVPVAGAVVGPLRLECRRSTKNDLSPASLDVDQQPYGRGVKAKGVRKWIAERQAFLSEIRVDIARRPPAPHAAAKGGLRWMWQTRVMAGRTEGSSSRRLKKVKPGRRNSVGKFPMARGDAVGSEPCSPKLMRLRTPAFRTEDAVGYSYSLLAMAACGRIALAAEVGNIAVISMDLFLGVGGQLGLLAIGLTMARLDVFAQSLGQYALKAKLLMWLWKVVSV